MLVCQLNSDLQSRYNGIITKDVNWSLTGRDYPNLNEMPSFIPDQKTSSEHPGFQTTADSSKLEGKQLQAVRFSRGFEIRRSLLVVTFSLLISVG